MTDLTLRERLQVRVALMQDEDMISMHMTRAQVRALVKALEPQPVIAVDLTREMHWVSVAYWWSAGLLTGFLL